MCSKLSVEHKYIFKNLEKGLKFPRGQTPKPAHSDMRDPNVQTPPTNYSESPWDLTRLAVILDCPKTQCMKS